MAKLTQREQSHVRSPVSEAWANEGLCTRDLLPHNEFNEPGRRIQDAHAGRIILDVAAPEG
jgi:hypothetical protein